MASYNIFNYNYRPAKSIERKIFVELLKELYGVLDAKKCTYIGMGSIFFADFKMIHKELGINKMVNIEKEVGDKARFEYNKPYSCIKLEWGSTTDVLPSLDWQGKKIIWLDYDQTLQPFMFEDIETIFTSVQPGSFYFISCNCTLPKYFDRVNQSYKISEFQSDFEGYTPFDLEAEMLTNKGCPTLLKTMVNDYINHILTQRNAATPHNDQLIYKQLFYLKYQDGAPMLSLGGIVLKRSEIRQYLPPSIFALPYVRTERQDFLDIQSPILTSSEIGLIDSHLPRPKNRFINSKKLSFIPNTEKEKYFNIYRYYPSYVEIRD